MSDSRPSIDKPAASPDADLACDFEIARALTEEGFRDRLGAAMLGAPVQVSDGVEVTFRGEAWPLVLRYVEVESQCCPFLNLAARKRDGDVLLSVTGRPEAQEVIAQIFAGRAPAQG